MAPDALSEQRCAKTRDGSWTFTARLTNRDQVSHAFTLAIGLTASTAVLGHAVVEKTLGPGESAVVSATGFGSDVPSDGVDCGATVSREGTE